MKYLVLKLNDSMAVYEAMEYGKLIHHNEIHPEPNICWWDRLYGTPTSIIMWYNHNKKFGYTWALYDSIEELGEKEFVNLL